MTAFGFIRHGITLWNKEGRIQGSSDIPLDEDGINMAQRTAQRLANEEWDIIYTSPLIRARRTAEIIAEKKSGIPIILDNRLRESERGLIEGTTEAERIARWGKSWRKISLGAETKAEVVARGISFIDEIHQINPGKRMLVVSHGDFISKLLHALLPEQSFEEMVYNTSLTVVHLAKDKNHCPLFNCTAHLYNNFSAPPQPQVLLRDNQLLNFPAISAP